MTRPASINALHPARRRRSRAGEGRIAAMSIAPPPGRHDESTGPAPDQEPERAPGNGKHYSIWTIGCQMNESESAQVGAALELAGYRQAPAESEADLIVLNSCVVRASAEQKVVGKLGALQKLK